MPHRLRKEEKVHLLEQLDLFETCTRRELGAIASITVEVERPAGSVLTRQGRDGGLMFVIAEGQAEILSTEGGGDRVIGQLKAGDVVGELSLIDGHTRSATVRAVTDVRLLEITSDDFTALVDSSPKFVRNLLRALSVKVRQAEALSS